MEIQVQSWELLKANHKLKPTMETYKMRYCKDCEKPFTWYLNSSSRAIVFILLVLIIVAVSVAVGVGTSGAPTLDESIVKLKPVYVKPGDPIAPRTSNSELGLDWVVVGNNVENEQLYFKESTEVVIGDDSRGYSNPIKIRGILKQKDNEKKFKLYDQYCPEEKCQLKSKGKWKTLAKEGSRVTKKYIMVRYGNSDNNKWSPSKYVKAPFTANDAFFKNDPDQG